MSKRIEPVKVVVTSEDIFIRQEIYGGNDSIVAISPTQIEALISELKKAETKLNTRKTAKV